MGSYVEIIYVGVIQIAIPIIHLKSAVTGESVRVGGGNFKFGFRKLFDHKDGLTRVAKVI